MSPRAGTDLSALAWALMPERLPALVLDLDAFERNIDRVRASCEAAGKRMRIASKSMRVPDLMARCQVQGGPLFQGVLCYSAPEAGMLHGLGFKDLVLAYPLAQEADFAVLGPLLRDDPSALAFMVDEPAHLDFLARWRRAAGVRAPLKVAIDMDVSYRPFGIHLGVRRSPVRTLEDFTRLAGAIFARPDELKLAGVMGYEAQLAGLPDRNPFAPLLNPAKRLIKRLSAADVRRKRKAVDWWCRSKGVTLGFFNGGGTGSLGTTLSEPWLTEATAGSGFFQSHLFDYYLGNRNEPALFIALRVTRAPEPGVVTCQSGGFIASGEIAPEKAPIPVWPTGTRAFGSEGFGEVQTPFRVPPGSELAPGGVVLCRPSKAGEVTEHFNEVLLMRGGRLEGRAFTYRGMGKAFL